jgi:hypothetical protein
LRGEATLGLAPENAAKCWSRQHMLKDYDNVQTLQVNSNTNENALARTYEKRQAGKRLRLLRSEFLYPSIK